MIAQPRDFARRAAEGAAGAPLSRDQKRRVILLMRDAHRTCAPDQDFEVWRRAQAHKACGSGSLRCCANSDFAPLVAHFLTLLGRSGEAFEYALRSQTEPRVWALRKLMAECATQGLSLEYARAIARNKYKTTDLEALSEKNLWHLVFSIRTRGQKNRAQKTGGGQTAASLASATLQAIRARASAGQGGA